MSYLVLARKYRPQTFDDVIGQLHVTKTLSNAISASRVSHALLFTGSRGTGKTTLARIVAKALNCEKGLTPEPCNACQSCLTISAGNSVDVIEIDGASNNGVEKVRELRDNIRYLPTHGRYRIYIIDEVHMLTVGAFNALLKILEEPPAHALFLFATTDPNKIPITILSRCQRHDLKRIDTPLLHDHLDKICRTENINLPEGSLWMIARQADGSVRDALSLLDLVFISGQNKTVEFITDLLGGIEQKILLDISENVFQSNLTAILVQIETAYTRGIDFLKLYRDILKHFRNLLILKSDVSAKHLIDLPASEITLLENQIKSVSSLYLGQIVDFLFDQESFMRFSSQPRLALEMIFIRLLQFHPQISFDVLVDRLENLRQEIQKTGSISTVSQFPKARKQDSSISEKTAEQKPLLDFSPEKKASPVMQNSIEDRIDFEKYFSLLSDKNPMLAGVLMKADAMVEDLQEGQLKLVIGGSEFGLEQLQKHKKELDRFSSEFFEQSVEVVFISKVETADDKKKKRQHDDALKEEILNHPILKEAIRLFKGEITSPILIGEEE